MQKTLLVFQGIFWRSFVEQKTKETFCFAKWWIHQSVAFATSCLNQYKFYYSYNYANLLLLLRTCKCKRIRRWKGRIRVCFVVTPFQYKKTITQLCFSSQNKSVCRKFAWSWKKWKSDQKVIHALFAQNPSVGACFTGKSIWPDFPQH